MVIKVGDRVLVEGVECEVLSVRKPEYDNPICTVERTDTGAKQRVRLTDADLVEGEDRVKDKGKNKGEGEGDKEPEGDEEPEPEPGRIPGADEGPDEE